MSTPHASLYCMITLLHRLPLEESKGTCLLWHTCVMTGRQSS